MSRHVLGFTVAALLAAGRAGAQVPPIPAPPQGPSLGARVAWGFPAGNIVSGESLSGALSGALPLQLDLSWRFDRHFSAGFLFSYAPGFVNACPPGDSCSGRSTGFGLQAIYTLDPAGALRPWLGIGVGYQWLKLEQTSAGIVYADTFSGFQWVDLQVGGDLSLTSRLWVGPYAAMTFATFSDVSASAGGLAGSGSIPSGDRRLHEWIVVGLRATYEF